MKDVFGLFDIGKIKEEIYNILFSALKDFSLTEHNVDVYAIVVGCESEQSGTITLHYQNNLTFKKTAEKYIAEWNYKEAEIYGFRALQYHVGDFESIDAPLIYTFEEGQTIRSEDVADFFEVYPLVLIGESYAELGIVPKLTKLQSVSNGISFDVIRPSLPYIVSELVVPNDKKDEYYSVQAAYMDILHDIVFYCTEKLKKNIDFINKTDDFVIFAQDFANVSAENIEKFARKTIDDELFAKLKESKT